jgi:hypothetical protein
MHEASSLADAASAAAWRGAWANAHDDGAHERTSDEGDAPPLALRAAAEPRARALDRTIAKRGSARSFTHEPISFETFSTLVASTVSAVPFDFRSAGEPPLDEPYVIVNAMDGLPPGRYALTRIGPARDGLGLLPLGSGIHRREAGFLGLGQELPADAAADVYYLASLDRVFDRLGARGYRAAQLEAAIHGGRMYLAAYAMGLSATGLTFFDDDVTSFFSPHAAGKAVMFLVAVGHGRKRAIGAR